jgi:hypothetical protein
MPTGFTYDSFQAAVVTQIPSLVADTNFQIILPDAIDYAELSIYRDLDFLALHGLLPLGNMTIGAPTLAVPSSVVVLESLFYGASQIPVVPASLEYIQAVYAGAANGPPVNFMTIGAASGGNWTPATQIIVGPAPDQAYPMTGYVTERQAPLSETNPTTFISLNLPDVFWAASMIFLAGYNRNFGAQSDDPRQAVSWSAEYQRLLHGADREELRKKFLAENGGSRVTPPPPMMPQPGAPH